MWTRADALTPGMKTVGGLEVVSVETKHGLHYVTFDGYSSTRRKQTIQYFSDQTFDMADRPEGRAPVAQRVNIIMTSDLSDKEGAETVTFGLDGTTYEIDLTNTEQEKLRKVLAEYVGAGRKVKGTGRKRASSSGSSSAGGPSAATIRAWAQEQGYDVPDRGRIPADVREAYASAN